MSTAKEYRQQATAKEYRQQAKEYLELANTTNEFYVRTALIELAQKRNRQARQAERRDRDPLHKAALAG
jgi:hypothetical protein